MLPALQQPAYLFKLLQRLIADFHLAAIAAVIDRDIQPERVRQCALERQRIGILFIPARDRRFGGLSAKPAAAVGS